MVPGTWAEGPRILNFNQILVHEEIPLNNLIKALLEACVAAVGADVEIEFAMTWPRGKTTPARFGFLQVRPMVVSDETVEITDEEFDVAAGPRFIEPRDGEREVEGVLDVVYVKPDGFEARFTPAIAAELEKLNQPLLDEGRPYLLVGFGRWGSSDPWLGIPVDWGQICGAKVIIEATLPNMNVDPSQGSHFFHNISSFKVSYLSVRFDRDRPIDWGWLASQETVAETDHVRHVRLRAPLRIKVDGRTGPRRNLARVTNEGRIMDKQEKPSEHILHSLQERAKELNCLYQVEEILSNPDESLDDVGRRLIDILPAGYQHVEVCRARLTLLGKVYAREDFVESEWRQAADINVQDDLVGEVEVFYDEEKPKADEGPFLKDERRLINAVAERLGLFILQRRLRSARKSWESAVEKISDPTHDDWSVILDFIRRTDRKLLARITRKMINHLCWAGVAEAQELLQRFLSSGGNFRETDENRPLKRSYLKNLGELTDTTFLIALQHYSEEELLVFLHTWIDEDKTAPLVDTLENPDSGLAEITDAVQRFESAGVNEFELPVAVQKVLRVSLLRRLFSDQPAFINVAKNYVEIRDFYDLLRHIVHPSQSHGKLGGKGAGLFLAWQVVKKTTEHADLFRNLRVPKTWFVSSDSLRLFMHFNNLEDIYDKKYTEIEKVRQDYPHIVQLFKNSQFPAEIVKQLSAALDDFENRPAHRAELESSRGPGRRGFLREVQEPLSRQSGIEKGAARRAPGRDRRGVRLGVRARSDRVPHRAGAHRRPRRDGNHDPGGRRRPCGQVLPSRVRRRGVQQQRVPLVGEDQARRRSAADGAGSGDARRRPHRGRLPRSSRAGPAGIEGQRDGGRSDPIFAA